MTGCADVALTGAVSLFGVVFCAVFWGGFESAAEAEKRRHIFVPDGLGCIGVG